jgi:creatine kinase
MHNEKLGMITCCPTNLGTGLRGSVHILLPRLIKRYGFELIDKIALGLNCQARGSTGEHS